MQHASHQPSQFLSQGLRLGLSVLPLLTWLNAASRAAEPAPAPEEVTVTATRMTRPAFDIPAAVDSVQADDHQAVMDNNLSDHLDSVAGVYARPRENRAQDEQLSVRGFGARAQFGIAGIRIFVDGIPATMPDGQGQISHINLDSIERIEVLRGAFSALYGNSSGGVLLIETRPGSEQSAVRVGLEHGSGDTQSKRFNATGTLDAIAYNVDYSRFSTDGVLQYTRTARDSANLRLDLGASANSQLTLTANHLSSPLAEDNGSLTKAQFESNNEQAAPVSLQFAARKSLYQTQVGLRAIHALGDQKFSLSAYTGQRAITQYLPTPVAAQNNPLSAGGVVDLGNRYYGSDLHWQHDMSVLHSNLSLLLGATYDALQSERKGYENFIGSTLGVTGALRRNESNTVHNFDQYLQLDWTLSPRWSMLAGIRHNAVHFDSVDRYITSVNPDDSGQVNYASWTPAISAAMKYNEHLQVYVSHGQSMDTPTFANLAYRPDGSSGLNLDLQAARTRNSEVGAKFRSQQFTANLAIFNAITGNELAVASSQGGRTTYRNVGRTARKGLEIGSTYSPTPALQAQLAYTWLDARYLNRFNTCTFTGCTVSNGLIVNAGNRIPALPRNLLHLNLTLKRSRWSAQVNTDYSSRVIVNDTNTSDAPAFGIVGLQGAIEFGKNQLTGHTFVRLNNIFDRHYVSTVVVNDANERYFQSGAGRSIDAGIIIKWQGSK